MDLGERAVQRYVLRPVLALWMVLALALLPAVIAHTLGPGIRSPVGRFLKHRKNVEAREWIAAARADSLLPAGARLLVKTDDRDFFHTLRYRRYPSWVLGEPEMESWNRACGEAPKYVAIYREGHLEVKGTDPP